MGQKELNKWSMRTGFTPTSNPAYTVLFVTKYIDLYRLWTKYSQFRCTWWIWLQGGFPHVLHVFTLSPPGQTQLSAFVASLSLFSVIFPSLLSSKCIKFPQFLWHILKITQCLKMQHGWFNINSMASESYIFITVPHHNNLYLLIAELVSLKQWVKSFVA